MNPRLSDIVYILFASVSSSQSQSTKCKRLNCAHDDRDHRCAWQNRKRLEVIYDQTDLENTSQWELVRSDEGDVFDAQRHAMAARTVDTPPPLSKLEPHTTGNSNGGECERRKCLFFRIRLLKMTDLIFSSLISRQQVTHVVMQRVVYRAHNITLKSRH